jgi:hypothetical protein
MKVGSLTILLRDFELLLEATGGSEALGDIRDFRAAFAGHEGSTVAQFVSKVAKAKGPSQLASVSPAIQRIWKILSKLQTLLVSAGSKTAAADIGKVINLLQNCDQVTVSRLAEDVNSWAARRPGKPKSPKSKRGIPNENFRSELGREYVHELKIASYDNAIFDQIVARLHNDKRIRKQEMREIAEEFLGYEIAKTKGRADALQDIIDRQMLSARQEARGRSHSRLKAW